MICTKVSGNSWKIKKTQRISWFFHLKSIKPQKFHGHSMGAAIQVVALYDVPIKDALGEAVEGEEVALMLVAGETFEEVVLEAWYGPVWIWRL